jgi:hypothetical protein
MQFVFERELDTAAHRITLREFILTVAASFRG